MICKLLPIVMRRHASLPQNGHFFISTTVFHVQRSSQKKKKNCMGLNRTQISAVHRGCLRSNNCLITVDLVFFLSFVVMKLDISCLSAQFHNLKKRRGSITIPLNTIYLYAHIFTCWENQHQLGPSITLSSGKKHPTVQRLQYRTSLTFLK